MEDHEGAFLQRREFAVEILMQGVQRGAAFFCVCLVFGGIIGVNLAEFVGNGGKQ